MAGTIFSIHSNFLDTRINTGLDILAQLGCPLSLSDSDKFKVNEVLRKTLSTVSKFDVISKEAQRLDQSPKSNPTNKFEEVISKIPIIGNGLSSAKNTFKALSK